MGVTGRELQLGDAVIEQGPELPGRGRQQTAHPGDAGVAGAVQQIEDFAVPSKIDDAEAVDGGGKMTVGHDAEVVDTIGAGERPVDHQRNELLPEQLEPLGKRAGQQYTVRVGDGAGDGVVGGQGLIRKTGSIPAEVTR